MIRVAATVHDHSHLTDPDAVPMEADPTDWAEQQWPVPLLDDEYPHANDSHLLVDASAELAVTGVGVSGCSAVRR